MGTRSRCSVPSPSKQPSDDTPRTLAEGGSVAASKGRVPEKIGKRCEGVLRGPLERLDRFHDAVVAGVLFPDFDR